MSRYTPYFGIVYGLVFGAFVITLFSHVSVVRAPIIFIPHASLTPSVVITVSATSTPATSTPKKIASSPQATPAPVPVASVVPTPPSAAAINAALDVSASALRSALVNIICYAPAGGTIRSISGSGIIVDPKGIILTNAHIAQYFLLADRGVSCTIRSGSPAADRYKAALIYISPTWLQVNPNVLTKTTPGGTGEYDFALLAISKSVTTNPLPSSFPYVPLATMPPTTGTPIVIASYGAQFLAPDQIASNLSPTIVFGSVKDVFTFGTNTIDVLALGGSVAAQEGSSGGGVADVSGDLVATITTSTISGATDTRSLNSITSSYIRAEYATETGQPLDLLLEKAPTQVAADFAPQISALEAIITANLP
ncbi:MAG: serine protease [Candidatus Paceibacterota bacterium]